MTDELKDLTHEQCPRHHRRKGGVYPREGGLSFSGCPDLSVIVGLDGYGGRVDFTVNNADEPSDPDADAALMAVLREHRGVIAEGLADAGAPCPGSAATTSRSTSRTSPMTPSGPHFR